MNRDLRRRCCIQQAILAAFQVQVLYNNDHQVTIRIILTTDTPRTITALLTDGTPAGLVTRTDAIHIRAPPLTASFGPR